MSNLPYWVKGLGIAISGAIVFSGNSTIAKVNQDATLSNNFGVATQKSIRIIKGGTQSKRNLPQCTCWSNDVHDFVNCPCH